MSFLMLVCLKVKLIFLFLCFCLKQQCAGSICEKYGLEECTCASSDGKDDRELCHVCCMRKSKIGLNCKRKHSARYLINLLTVFIF